jgi:ribonuclease BN (tRNA processing enzyme)
MKITMLGTGTSYPDPERVQSGILVESGEDKILLDIGSGVLHRLAQLGIDLRKISYVFISHFHIDHCSDFMTLCQSLWMTKSERPLKVYGPPFIHDWIRGFRETAFPYLRDKLEVQASTLNENEDIKLGETTVSNRSTIHGTMETRAFKIRAGGKTLVFSSDTAPSQELNRFAKNSDILIHECNWLDGQHPQGVHTSPSELALIVRKTTPSRVVLTHLSPEVIRSGQTVVDIVGSKHDADVRLAEDLMSFEI